MPSSHCHCTQEAECSASFISTLPIILFFSFYLQRTLYELGLLLASFCFVPKSGFYHHPSNLESEHGVYPVLYMALVKDGWILWIVCLTFALSWSILA
jgi:hypothetical protein